LIATRRPDGWGVNVVAKEGLRVTDQAGMALRAALV
jgi:hypothetical protein